MTAPNIPQESGDGELKGKHGTSGPARRSTGKWTPEEDEVLCKAVERFQGKKWKQIAECVKGRTDVQCLHRWQKVLNPELVKGPWSKEEDATIIALVETYGPKKWSRISQHLPGRNGKQCRERWHNHLKPGINKDAWTQEEELTLIRAHESIGNQWAELRRFLPGRSENSIKNYWNSFIKKKLDSYYAPETHAHETEKLPALSWHPSSSEGLGGHSCVPLLDSDLMDSILLRNDSNAPIQGCHLFGATEFERKTDTNDGFIDTDGHVTSRGNDDNDGIPEQQGLSYIPKDSLKLVPLNSFSSPSRVNKIYFPIDDKPAEKDKGALCYEPPRFLSADIPFLSCDLVPSKSDLRQEHSPFGIRQLISSMNCTTPLRLLDSPCHVRSPDVMLKDAAKSYSNAPSILTKRHRDLLSPVLDRRKEKKLKRAAGTSSLAKDFSCLDVMLDKGDDCMSSRRSESPENKNRCASPSEAKDNRYSASGRLDHEIIPIDEEPKVTLKSDGVTSMQTVKGCTDGGASAKYNQKTSGSFVEIRRCSPGMTGCRSDKKVNTSAKDLSYQHKRSLGDVATEEVSSEPPCTVDSIPLSAIDKTNTAETSFDIEFFNIFDGTPYRKLLDTPSPWKSPSLFGSFLQSPKLPPEITSDDIGGFMPPGERSYDAIGLMKHLSEHSATAYADALEVLDNDTPETILKKRQLNKSIQGKENHHHPHDQLGNRSQVERTLDFSDCGTPEKAKVSSSPSPGGDSSPSSYLLKSCR